MSDVTKIEVEGDVGVLTVDFPPVNALSAAVRQGILDGFGQLARDPAVRAIVLICAGRTFIAGADISEFGKPPVPPSLADVFAAMDAAGKPSVAAIHGTALGGGLETALNCNHRIAVPSARLGLPEVNLGLLPGAGGTQRLPRIVGVEVALDLIVGGRPIKAREALDLGVIDALAGEGALREDAIALARRIADQPLVRVRDREDRIAAARGRPEIFAEFRKKHARAHRGFKAPENIIKAIEAAVELPFDEGMVRERDLFLELRGSTESQAQRYFFFAERDTVKIPDIPAATPVRPVASVGVIGAGTMGGGITMNFLNIGIPVTLVEMSREALDRGLAVIRRNYENTARKGRLTQDQVEQRMALITPSLAFEDLGAVDLVIEAAFEEMAIKQDIFGRLDAIARPGAILASNTSFLDLDRIAAATRRPRDVVGLHFFSPANVMKLLEVVRGAHTAPEVVATAMALARKIGKTPVLSGVCHGFIANRIMATRSRQADAIILEGSTPAEVDKAIYDYGFAMGPFQMIDLVGLDVLTRGLTERTVRGDFVQAGRLGQKQNGGFYDYDAARAPVPSARAAEIIADFAAYKGVVPGGPKSAEAILERLLYPVVNEGAKVLEEGIALRASDIDVAAVLGYNWPVYTGGPMFWADTVGLPKIVAALKAMEAAHGAEFRPCALLERLAAEGGTFARG
jgi:3-hydroxyacyl-CoA dehydrogenase